MALVVQDPLALTLAMVLVVAACLWLEQRYGWARQASASLLIIAAGALLSNLGFVPAASGVYDVVVGPVTSLAIVWLLLAVDLRDVRRVGPRMLLAFGFAVAATAVGSLIATLLFRGTFGDDTWRLAAVLTGTYSGGSVNFVAVGRAVGLDGNLYVAATAADNVMTAIWMGLCIVAPALLGRFYPAIPASVLTGSAATSRARTDDGALESPGSGTDEMAIGAPLGTVPRLRVTDMAWLLTLGLLVMFVSERLHAAVAQVPSVLWLTSLALAVAQVPAVRRLSGSLELGLLALNLFFVVIGIYSRFGEILRVGPQVFYMTALVVGIHGVVTFTAARLLRIDLATAAVASQAAIGGPSSAMAIAVAKGWRGLVLPGVLAGLLGYAVGNYLGLAVGHLTRWWLG